jgi:ribose transport system permease protein
MTDVALPESARPWYRGLSPRGLVERFGLVLVWGILVVVFGALRPSTFLQWDNFSTIFGTQAVLVVLTMALLIPLIAGDYDLSVAFNLSLCAMVLAVLNVNYHWNIYLCILIALACGAGVGLANGAIIVFFGIDPFIVTLGSGTFLYGVVLWISASQTISGISDNLVTPVVVDRFLNIPLEFYYGLALCIFVWYMIEFTPLGRRLLFVGRGRNVARLSGIRVGRVRIGALVASGLVAAGAGILYAGTTGAADPNSGQTFLLPAFAAAFLGATTISPGFFNPFGALVAVYFLQTGITGFQLVGVESYVQQLFYGGALVVAVAISQVARRREAQSMTG